MLQKKAREGMRAGTVVTGEMVLGMQLGEMVLVMRLGEMVQMGVRMQREVGDRMLVEMILVGEEMKVPMMMAQMITQNKRV